MSEQVFHHWLLLAWFGLAGAIFATLFFITAPYGRHARRGWGPTVGARFAWMLMEFPSWGTLTLLLLLRERPVGAAAMVLYALWMGHYAYRSLVYPFTLSSRAHRVPVLIILFGVVFNMGNGYLNGRSLFAFGPAYDLAWLGDIRFVAGALLFCTGLGIHLWADISLRRQRERAGGGYIVPQGGLYSLVSSPNYLGEVIEWCGWALASWSLAGLSFAVWTIANLAPRAHAHRAWYRSTFTEYPSQRRRLLPFVW
jgi:3-oxo-5-alpha-steroid 4-dehydrogenase 1